MLLHSEQAPAPVATAPLQPRIAYFSMEIALETGMPTYAGGLGVLAGDTLRSAADLGVPMVGVTLLHRKGFLRQGLDDQGNQVEEPVAWEPERFLEKLDSTASVNIEGRRVLLRGWRYWMRGESGWVIPIYLLDSDLPQNDPWDRTLTDHLYGGDNRYRLAQEVVLGIGGFRMLHRIGHRELAIYHMNEGHAALLILGLLEHQVGESNLMQASTSDLAEISRQCVFTTHTPVPAAHDRFPEDLVRQVLGSERAHALAMTNCCPDNILNMTYLALRCSRYVNGVAMQHGAVSSSLFPEYPIHAITNGVHVVTWASEPFRRIYDHHLPGWRHDNLYLRYAIKIPTGEILQAHAEAKRRLLVEVVERTSLQLDERVFTIGFGRRATGYKRPDLLLTEPERLQSMAQNVGPLQVLYAGKAHARDDCGKELIRRIVQIAAAVSSDRLKIAYVPDYDVELASLFTSGVDLWLNTPQRPQEASGTSGMKAALNGVPSLSVLDGWWVEGCLEGTTGWAIGDYGQTSAEVTAEVASLYGKLERVIMPMFYGDAGKYAGIMRSAIALNGSFFNSHRMLAQYVLNAYTPTRNSLHWSSPA